jgi:hypothetical protein
MCVVCELRGKEEEGAKDKVPLKVKVLSTGENASVLAKVGVKVVPVGGNPTISWIGLPWRIQSLWRVYRRERRREKKKRREKRKKIK